MDNYLTDGFTMAKNQVLTYHWSIYYSQRLWTYFNRCGALFVINPKDGSSEFVCWAEDHKEGMRMIGECNGFIIGMVRTGRFIQITDTRTFESRIIVPETGGSGRQEYLPVLDGEQLALYSDRRDEIIICSLCGILDAGNLNDITYTFQKIKTGRQDKIRKLFRTGKGVLGTVQNQSALVWMDIRQKTCKKLELDRSGQEIADLIIRDDKVYILFYAGRLAIYDRLTEKVTGEYEMRKEKKQGTEFAYERMVIAGNRIWLFPALGDAIIIYDPESQESVVFNDYPPDFRFLFSAEHQKYLDIIRIQGMIYAGQRNANYMLVICEETGRTEWVRVKLPEKFYERDWRKKILEDARKRIIEEWQMEIIDLVRDAEKPDNLDQQRTTCGKKIYELVKNET